MESLFAIDAAMGEVVRSTREPMLGPIRLAWWRERLEELDEGSVAPAEPRLQAAFEVLRAAVIEGGLHVTLRRAFDDPQAWGVLLADVARQVSQVYEQQGEKAAAEVLATIRAAFEKEMNAPANAGSISQVS
jgi:hypothetical protein